MPKTRRSFFYLWLACTFTVLVGCYHPPFNNFKPKSFWMSPWDRTKSKVIKTLHQHNIQVVNYRGQSTLIVPSDQYFLFESAEFHENQYQGLEALIDYIKMSPHCSVTVASFSDDVDPTQKYWRLTNARAHAMVTFLWAHGLSSKQLKAERFGSAYPVAENKTVRGRAMNRRVEIQLPVRGCRNHQYE